MKLHVHLARGSSLGKTCEVFQGLLNPCVFSGGGLEGSNKEKMGKQQKSSYGEIWRNVVRVEAVLVKIPWHSPCVTV